MANFEGNLQSKTSIHIGNVLQLALSCKQKSSVCLLENVCGWLKTTKTQIFLLEYFALYSSTFSYLVGGSLCFSHKVIELKQYSAYSHVY